MSNPRVLQVTGAYFPEISSGGLQARAAAKLLASTVEVRVLTTATTATLPATDVIDGVPVSRIHIDIASRWSRWQASWRMLIELVRMLPSTDLIHVQGYSAKNVLIALTARILRRPIVLHLQTSKHDEPATIRALGLLHWWAFRSVERYLSVSESLRLSAIDGGIPAAKIVLIPNGVDLTRFSTADATIKQQLRAALALPVDRPLVLFVGVVSPDKQPHVLFDAWARLQTLPGARSTLVFVGATDPSLFELEDRLHERLESRATELHLRDRLFFVAPTNRIEDYYRAADVVVMPSRREGLPNVVLEAMACGLPVVASRLPGSTDTIIDDGANGILVTPGDVNGFSQAIRTVLADPSLAARIGAAARRTAEARYGMASVAAQWLDVYRDVLARS